MAQMGSTKEYKKPFVSIIIPVCNAERTIEETFVYLFGGISSAGRNISGLKYPANKMEVIVAYEESKDNTFEVLKKWQKINKRIILIPVKKCNSLGRVRNAALKKSKGDYVLFTNGDCAPNSNWVEKILEPFLSDPKIGMVGGEIYTLKFYPLNKIEQYCEQIGFQSVGDRMGKKSGGYYPRVHDGRPHEVNGSKDSPFFECANAAISRKVLKAIGVCFWGESTGEDVDFSLRVGRSGFRLYFQPEAIVKRVQQYSLKLFCQQLWLNSFGHPLLIRTHAKRALEIRLQLFGEHSFVIPFPFQTLIYWGDFHFMHLFGFFAFIRTIFLSAQGYNPPGSVISGVLGLWCLFIVFFVKYFMPVLRIQPASEFIYWSWIRYRSNLAMLMGGLRGSFSFKRFYLESSC